MKNLMPLFAVLVASSAFAGTEISQYGIANSADFFKGEASNFRITSIELGKDPVQTTAVTDDDCVEYSDSSPMECTTYKSINADVVHVDVTFDSDETKYEDGANTVTLSLPVDQFSAQELALIKKGAFSKVATSLVKLSTAQFSAQVSNLNDNCGEDADADCRLNPASYDSANVTKIRLSVSR